ncbi:uncharacterized protein LOC128556334 [Mercenaria mercenaria]|uniref:uncharacterized protein LOC128556334 n=1 Tax=Mercenaria mercenaria TaxID=6596 RepID=UPI00234EBFBA|nr:uncharacterized protein LOC128556334 [Mercenaria mercenaria]
MHYLLFLCSFTLVGATETYDNVIFQKINEVSTTRSHWSVALVLDTSIFSSFLDQIDKEIETVNSTTENVSNHLKNNPKNLDLLPYLLSISNVKLELQYVRSTYAKIFNSYSDYLSLHVRNKRSILGLGSVFKFLFGTADNDEVQVIKHNVVRLANTQKSIIHILENNLSILNISRSHISENRQSINELIQALQQVDEKMKKWQGRMEKQIEQIQGYTINYNNLQLIIDEIKQTVFYAKAHLSEFKSQLDILSAGRVFPGLLSPFHLRALLVEIQNQAPKTYALPADPSTDLWKYYQFLRSSTMIAEDKIIINIHVPLIDFNSRFDVYRIHNFELPYSNINRSSIPQSSQVHLVAKYDLEFSALLFNRERTKFAVILPSELESCKSSFTQFCQVRSPFYQASMSELCVTALFLRNPS